METCPSVGELARSGDVATTWSVNAKTPGNHSRPVPYQAEKENSGEWRKQKGREGPTAFPGCSNVGSPFRSTRVLYEEKEDGRSGGKEIRIGIRIKIKIRIKIGIKIRIKIKIKINADTQELAEAAGALYFGSCRLAGGASMTF